MNDALLDKIESILNRQGGTLDVEGVPFHIREVETLIDCEGRMRLTLRIFTDVDTDIRLGPPIEHILPPDWETEIKGMYK